MGETRSHIFPDGRTKEGCLIALALSGILRAVNTLHTVSLFHGEGKRTMNDHTRREMPYSARQIVPGQLSYRQLSLGQLSSPRARRSLRRFVKGMSVVVIVSLLPVSYTHLTLPTNREV